MPAILLLHGVLARALVLYLAVLGGWGLVAWRRGRGVSPSYRGALVLAWVMGIAQGALGVLQAAAVAPPRDSLHVLYGIAIAVAVPAGLFLTRDQRPPRQSLVLGLVTLFTSGLAVRGIMTS